MVLLLFKILRLEQKIVNQLSRQTTNSLSSLECFMSKIATHRQNLAVYRISLILMSYVGILISK